MGSVEVLTNLTVAGTVAVAKNFDALPETAEPGTLILKGDVLHAYIKFGEIYTWYPMSNKTRSYIHTQGLPATTWVVNHGMGSTDVWLQIKDSDNRFIAATTVVVDENTINVILTTAKTGTVFLVAPDNINVPQVTASVLNVGNNVVIDSSGIRVNGSYIQSISGIQTQIDTAVADEATARQDAIDTLSADVVHTSAVGVSVASLVGGKVPVSQLPTQVSSTDDVPEGQSHLYFTTGRAQGAQVQPDWNASGTKGEILNKPTLGTAAAKNLSTQAWGNNSASEIASTEYVDRLRTVPTSASTTVSRADIGKCIVATGSIAVPQNVMQAGDTLSIYNSTGSNIAITTTLPGLYLAGTSSVGARTLATHGIATIWFASATEAVIAGAGLS